MATPDSTHRHKGRAFSPVIEADSKLFGLPPFLCVDVRFPSVEALEALIAALTKLRDFPDDGFDHVHLQDKKSAPSSAELIFWHPSVQRDEGDRTCVSEAGRILAALSVQRQHSCGQ